MRRGVDPGDFELSEHWHPDTLPGKRGIDLARAALSSKVELMVGDFMKVDLDALGRFDVVLFLGVLYHLKHPLLALQRLAAVTREVAIIETEASEVPRRDHIAFCEFFETNELNGDTSNWWAPNAKALVGMCRTAGFREIKLTVNTKAPNSNSLNFKLRRFAGRLVPHYRLFAHAYR